MNKIKTVNLILSAFLLATVSSASMQNAFGQTPSSTASPSATPTETPAASPTAAPAASPAATPAGTPSAQVIENSPEVKAVPSSKTVTEKMSKEDAIRFYRQRQRITPDAAKVYDGYLGVELGLAQVSGTYYNLDSGFAYGITAGIDTPIIGVGFTARHQANGIYRADSKEKITQLLMELNFFSYLLLNGGFQIGDIITKLDDKTSNSLGLGMHAGFDLHFTKELTAGLGAYWTFVLQPNDKHSLFNIMIPVKYWF